MNRVLESKDEKINNAELKTLNDILDRFVYSCSHDLKGPLASIKGLLRLAEVSSRKEATSECLHLINESIARMDKFLTSLESYVGNARSPVLRNEVDFEGIVNDILFENQSLIRNKGIKVSKKLDQDLSFRSDAVRVRLILANLIENAIHFQDLNKKERFIDIDIKVNLEEVRIEICDNGEGILREHINKVFNMFFRASEASKGSGLGLYLAKEAVNKLLGTIDFDSSRGVGTNFMVILPRGI